MWGSREGLVGAPQFVAEPEKHLFTHDKGTGDSRADVPGNEAR
jgi:hypothetical protein